MINLQKNNNFKQKIRHLMFLKKRFLAEFSRDVHDLLESLLLSHSRLLCMVLLNVAALHVLCSCLEQIRLQRYVEISTIDVMHGRYSGRYTNMYLFR